jgi:molecular chaperone GrpE (heat shock protein)
MANRIHIVKSWRQIAAEVAQEDDPQKLSQLTEELHRALQRELQARAESENTRAKAA